MFSARRDGNDVFDGSGSVNAFALDLYRALSKEAPSKNVLFSPYSAFVALAMAAEGACGETANEFGTVMRLPAAMRRGRDHIDQPWDFAPVHQSLGALSRSFAAHALGHSAEARARAVELRARSAVADRAGVQAMKAMDYPLATRHDEEARRLSLEARDLQEGLERAAVHTANALWIDAGCAIAPRFRRAIKDHYGLGTIHSTDFRQNADATRQQINAWAADQTAHRINNVVSPSTVRADSRLVIANAAFFQSQWACPFGGSTRPEPFLTGEETRLAPLMNTRRRRPYVAFNADGTVFPTPTTVAPTAHEEDLWAPGLAPPPRFRQPAPDDPAYYPGPGGWQIVELAYKGGDMAMTVFLPRSPEGLGDLEQQLTADRMDSWIGQLTESRVDVYLPRFRIESNADMRGPLQALGMRRTFSNPATGPGADFSGLTPHQRPEEALFVSALSQNAFLDVQERGTVAAAVSTLGMHESGLPHPKIFVPVFRADRPFLFLIRHVPTGLVLFMGRVLQPHA